MGNEDKKKGLQTLVTFQKELQNKWMKLEAICQFWTKIMIF